MATKKTTKKVRVTKRDVAAAKTAIHGVLAAGAKDAARAAVAAAVENARLVVERAVSPTGELPSERAMRETAEVAVAVGGKLMLSAAAVKAAKVLQAEKKSLEERLAALGADLKAREEAIIAALDAGLAPGPGCPAVAVDESERVNIKWKDEAFVLVDKLGLNRGVYEAEVRARTPVTKYRRLIINGDGKVKKG